MVVVGLNHVTREAERVRLLPLPSCALLPPTVETALHGHDTRRPVAARPPTQLCFCVAFSGGSRG
eukprot:2071972-Rhodomonas_salina.3